MILGLWLRVKNEVKMIGNEIKGWDEGKNDGIRESLTPRASHPRNLTLLLILGLTPMVSHEESSTQAFQNQIIDFLLFFEENYILL